MYNEFDQPIVDNFATERERKQFMELVMLKKRIAELEAIEEKLGNAATAMGEQWGDAHRHAETLEGELEAGKSRLQAYDHGYDETDPITDGINKLGEALGAVITELDEAEERIAALLPAARAHMPPRIPMLDDEYYDACEAVKAEKETQTPYDITNDLADMELADMEAEKEGGGE